MSEAIAAGGRPVVVYPLNSPLPEGGLASSSGPRMPQSAEERFPSSQRGTLDLTVYRRLESQCKLTTCLKQSAGRVIKCVLHYLREKRCVLGWILGVVTSKSIETSRGKPLQSLVLITRCTDGLLAQCREYWSACHVYLS